MKKRPLVSAQDFLRQAGQIVRERADTHGDFLETHERIANLWNAYLSNRKCGLGPRIGARDAAMMLMLMKIAREQGGDFNLDTILDILGYGAGVGEIAVAEAG